jgi:hypothetical protein
VLHAVDDAESGRGAARPEGVGRHLVACWNPVPEADLVAAGLRRTRGGDA